MKFLILEGEKQKENLEYIQEIIDLFAPCQNQLYLSKEWNVDIRLSDFFDSHTIEFLNKANSRDKIAIIFDCFGKNESPKMEEDILQLLSTGCIAKDQEKLIVLTDQGMQNVTLILNKDKQKKISKKFEKKGFYLDIQAESSFDISSNKTLVKSKR